ncbi:hypothetical protein D9M69_610830 [compost metagenome]
MAVTWPGAAATAAATMTSACSGVATTAAATMSAAKAGDAITAAPTMVAAASGLAMTRLAMASTRASPFASATLWAWASVKATPADFKAARVPGSAKLWPETSAATRANPERALRISNVLVGYCMESCPLLLRVSGGYRVRPLRVSRGPLRPTASHAHRPESSDTLPPQIFGLHLTAVVLDRNFA